MPASPESELTRILNVYMYAARKDLENELNASAIPDNSYPSVMYHSSETLNQKGSALKRIYTFKNGEIPRLVKIVMDEVLDAAHALLSQHTLVTAESVTGEIEASLPESTIGKVFFYIGDEFGESLKNASDEKNWVSSKFTEKLSQVSPNPIDRAIYETGFVCFMKALAKRLCILHHYREHSYDSADWRTLMSIDEIFTHAELKSQVDKLPVREQKPRKKPEIKTETSVVVEASSPAESTDSVADLIAAI